VLKTSRASYIAPSNSLFNIIKKLARCLLLIFY
jgi:hypothetical protein